MDAIYYTLCLAATMCFCFAKVHGRLEKVWKEMGKLEARISKLDGENHDR